MRMIGHLSSKTNAAAFSDFLYVQGISNVIEPEKDGYAVWIHSEDELEKARGLLDAFSKNPEDPKYAQHSRQAQELRQREEQEEKAAEKRHFSRERIFRRSSMLGAGPLTMVLIVVSIVATVCLSLGVGLEFLVNFYFSNRFKGAPEILKGEVWRLVTPIFMHAKLDTTMGLLHLPFNMLWLYVLGGVLESRQGTGRFFIMVVVVAAISNAAQYYFGGPYFGGMSGVLYGLLGYIWIKGKFDPNSDLYLHPQIVTMMLVWFFICLFGWMPRVANAAHAGGLAVGMIWGYLSAMISRAR